VFGTTQPHNQRLKVFRVWRDAGDFATFHCAHCGISGYAHRNGDQTGLTDAERRRIEKQRQEAARRHREAVADSQANARWLWGKSQPINGTFAEAYLREARGICGLLPPTLRFLPACNGYPPAMVAALGTVREDSIADDGSSRIDGGKIRAVHLTRLKPDGPGKADDDKAKIVVGKEVFAPIWLSPVTDSMALLIAEGIENALTVRDATGLSAWAAGCAARLPLMAEQLPDFIKVVNIIVDDDVDGRRYAFELEERLKVRRISCRAVSSW
jgi:hypothetical protein